MKISNELISSSPIFINPSFEQVLDLRGCHILNLDNLSATLDYFNCIDLSNNLIEEVAPDVELKNLRTLILSNNKIFKVVAIDQLFPSLENLVLSNNNIKDIESIIVLRKCKNLKRLFLINNPVSFISDYRLKICSMLPNLKVLDFTKFSKNEKNEARNKYPNQSSLEITKILKSMSKKEKLKKLIESVKTLEEANRLELLISSEQLSDDLIDQLLVKVI